MTQKKPNSLLLWLNDSLDWHQEAKRLLSQHYSVKSVADEAAAIEAVYQQLPNLILGDAEMLELTSFRWLSKLQADRRLQHVPIVLLATRAQEALCIQGLEAGADDYLLAPFSERELLTRVQVNLKTARHHVVEHNQLEQVLQQMPLGFTIAAAPSGKLLFHNQEAVQLLRHPLLPSETYQGYAQYGALHADGCPYQPDEYPIARSLLAGEVVKTEEMNYRRGDGTFAVFLVNSAPIRDLESRIIAAVSTFHDISDFKQAHREQEQLLEKLNTEHRLLEAILQQMPAGLVVAEAPSGRIVLVNERGQEILPSSLLNKQLLEEYWFGSLQVLYPNQQPYAPTNLPLVRSLFKGEVIKEEEIHLVYPSGNHRIVLVNSAPIQNESGNIVAAVATFDDITERRQVEAERDRLLQQEQAAREAAEAANQLKERFLAVLSHELRSPLNPILGWAQMLKTRPFKAGVFAQGLEAIERNALLQIQLIDDLLDVSRILRGKIHLDSHSVSLAFIVTVALETMYEAAQSKSIEIQTVISPDVGLVEGDAGRLQQIVSNLLSNAVKFTPVGGRVDVHLQQVDSIAQIQVSDTGKGIDPNFLPHVFDEFRQADTSTTRQFGGLGLGLAIVHHLTELHGGTVKAESPGIGRGSTFTVRLPLISQASSASGLLRQEGDGPRLEGLQILVVDDEADTREFLSFVLEEAGATVTAVASAEKALEAIAQCQPDLLLSDIGMPKRDGYALVRHLRANSPERGGQTPAIALTAYAEESARQKALEAGFQSHLSKPVNSQKLVKLIFQLVEGK